MIIVKEFAQITERHYGQAGLAWLHTLPDLLCEFTERWSLTLFPPFEPISFNYVLPALRADGREVVLKTGFPNPELLAEIYALQHYAGQGSVQLLESDRENQVMLLERIRPGEALFDLDDDDQRTLIAAQVMQQLWKPVADVEHFPTTSRWMRTLGDILPQSGPVVRHLVNAAQSLTPRLLASEDGCVLLHGDLHHWNVLSTQRQTWLALDPKGIIGEPVFDVGALLRNPVTDVLSMPDFTRVTRRRLAILAEVLGFDRTRMLQWSLAQAVLSAQWAYEMGGEGWQTSAYCAQVFYDLLV